MTKILKGNIVKCQCGKYLQYNENDITERAMGYGVATYNGETYIAKFIICPNCKRTIEVYK